MCKILTADEWSVQHPPIHWYLITDYNWTDADHLNAMGWIKENCSTWCYHVFDMYAFGSAEDKLMFQIMASPNT